LAQDFRDAEQRGNLSHPIDTTLEAIARLAAQAKSARGARDRHRLEVGTLEQNRGSRIADLGIQPAHDAGDREGLFRIGD